LVDADHRVVQFILSQFYRFAHGNHQIAIKVALTSHQRRPPVRHSSVSESGSHSDCIGLIGIHIVSFGAIVLNVPVVGKDQYDILRLQTVVTIVHKTDEALFNEAFLKRIDFNCTIIEPARDPVLVAVLLGKRRINESVSYHVLSFSFKKLAAESSQLLTKAFRGIPS